MSGDIRRLYGLGLGRRRSKLGKWLDERRISQVELTELAQVSRATITRLCSDPSAQPTMKTANKIVRALRKFDSEISSEDFW